MKKLFLVANWKSNKTKEEALSWLSDFKNHLTPNIEKEVIICPAYTLLDTVKDFITKNNLPVKVGSQNISAFDEGPFTGEINARQIKDFADFVMIGHSERRINLQEDDKILLKKIQKAKDLGLKVIFCIQGLETVIPQNVDIATFEPIFAVDSGYADTPENARKVAIKVKEGGNIPFMYGGSVTSKNVSSFTEVSEIDGVLVGRASLDPIEFARIIELA